MNLYLCSAFRERVASLCRRAALITAVGNPSDCAAATAIAGIRRRQAHHSTVFADSANENNRIVAFHLRWYPSS